MRRFEPQDVGISVFLLFFSIASLSILHILTPSFGEFFPSPFSHRSSLLSRKLLSAQNRIKVLNVLLCLPFRVYMFISKFYAFPSVSIMCIMRHLLCRMGCYLLIYFSLYSLISYGHCLIYLWVTGYGYQPSQCKVLFGHNCHSTL